MARHDLVPVGADGTGLGQRYDGKLWLVSGWVSLCRMVSSTNDDPAAAFEVRGGRWVDRLLRFLRAEWRQLGLCLVAGFVLATLPNWITLYRSGSILYLADEDEVECYAPALAQAYERHPWSLGDPALARGGESLYPRLQFVPAVLLAKALRLEAIDILFLWRMSAGLSLGLVFYLLTRQLLGNPNWALMLTLMLLSDQGTTDGQPLRQHLDAGLQLLSGEDGNELKDRSQMLPQFRLVTPGLS